jgi:uncharacterized protein (TIGR02217 family)
MTIPLFPSLPGLGWSRAKRPIFSTRIATHVSGREVRSANYAYPLYEFELTFELLRAGAAQELETLMGFFLQCQGQAGVFRYLDPEDNRVAAQSLGTGDGVTTAFTLVRNLGGWVEPVGFVEAVTGVTLGGVAAAGWAIASPNTLAFATAPAAGAAITADFSFSFLCRFGDDKHSYEEFMTALWANQSVKFQTVRAP